MTKETKIKTNEPIVIAYKHFGAEKIDDWLKITMAVAKTANKISKTSEQFIENVIKISTNELPTLKRKTEIELGFCPEITVPIKKKRGEQEVLAEIDREMTKKEQEEYIEKGYIFLKENNYREKGWKSIHEIIPSYPEKFCKNYYEGELNGRK